MVLRLSTHEPFEFFLERRTFDLEHGIDRLGAGGTCKCQ